MSLATGSMRNVSLIAFIAFIFLVEKSESASALSLTFRIMRNISLIASIYLVNKSESMSTCVFSLTIRSMRNTSLIVLLSLSTKARVRVHVYFLIQNYEKHFIALIYSSKLTITFEHMAPLSGLLT